MATYVWTPDRGTRGVSSQTVPVTTGTKIVFVGDSLTFRGYFDQTQSTDGGTNLLVQQLATSGAKVNAINSGVNGNKASDIAAAVPARITNYHPDVVVLFVGLNDCTTPIALSTYQTNMTTIITSTKAALPSVKIVVVGIIVYFELWASTPAPAHYSGNAFDTGAGSIDVFNTAQATLAATYGCTYVDPRPSFGLAEATLNTPEPGVTTGKLTVDGFHLNGTGQNKLSTILRPYFAVL